MSDAHEDDCAIAAERESVAAELLRRVARDRRALVRKLILGEAISNRRPLGTAPRRERAGDRD